MPNDAAAAEPVRLLYCHCRYAKVISPEVKAEVLAGLSEDGVSFEAVADLCEMSARKDPSLARLAAPGQTKIAACFPRAVKWLFHAAGTPLSEEDVEVLNMREDSAEDVLRRLRADDIEPNVATVAEEPKAEEPKEEESD